MKKKILVFVGIILIVVIAIFLLSGIFSNKEKQESFKVNTLLLKTIIKQGESLNKSFIVENLGEEKEFEIIFRGLENFVFLNETNFFLEAFEKKTIIIEFKDDYFNSKPGIYAGSILVKSEKEEKIIPITLEIQTKQVIFGVNLDVSPQYKQIFSGEEINLGIKIFNFQDTKTHNVDVTYIIYNLDGEIILSENENLAVGSESSFTKTISVPKNINYGNYVFGITINYENSTGTSSYLFNIEKKDIFNFSGNILIVLSVIAGFLLLIFVIVGLFLFVFVERDKLLLELKKQQESELEFCIKKIEEKERNILSKSRNLESDREIREKLKKVKKEAIKNLKEKHKEQKNQIKILKRKKKISLIKSKLNEWKKSGFNIKEFDLLFKKELSNQEKLKQWKNQGYDIDILKNRKV